MIVTVLVYQYTDLVKLFRQYENSMSNMLEYSCLLNTYIVFCFFL